MNNTQLSFSVNNSPTEDFEDILTKHSEKFSVKYLHKIPTTYKMSDKACSLCCKAKTDCACKKSYGILKQNLDLPIQSPSPIECKINEDLDNPVPLPTLSILGDEDTQSSSTVQHHIHSDSDSEAEDINLPDVSLLQQDYKIDYEQNPDESLQIMPSPTNNIQQELSNNKDEPIICLPGDKNPYEIAEMIRNSSNSNLLCDDPNIKYLSAQISILQSVVVSLLENIEEKNETNLQVMNSQILDTVSSQTPYFSEMTDIMRKMQTLLVDVKKSTDCIVTKQSENNSLIKQLISTLSNTQTTSSTPAQNMSTIPDKKVTFLPDKDEETIIKTCDNVYSTIPDKLKSTIRRSDILVFLQKLYSDGDEFIDWVNTFSPSGNSLKPYYNGMRRNIIDVGYKATVIDLLHKYSRSMLNASAHEIKKKANESYTSIKDQGNSITMRSALTSLQELNKRIQEEEKLEITEDKPKNETTQNVLRNINWV